MNEDQQKFYDFIMASLRDGEQKPATALLTEAFDNLKNKAVRREYLLSFASRMRPMLRPECVSAFPAALDRFVEATTSY